MSNMKNMYKNALILIFLVTTVFIAQADVPLHIGTTSGIHDQSGEILRGSAPESSYFGGTYVEGDVVQILQANSGIFSPAIDGTPDTNNTVIATIRIGEGVDPSLGEVGMFGASLAARPSGQIFARAFNGTNLVSASFYGDSQVFTVPAFGSDYDVFVPVISAVDEPLDASDTDSDGLNNSWEEALGSDPNDTDTDEDGMADNSEFRAGTDLNDATSLLVMVQLFPAGGNDLTLSWDSVAGKSYQVEYTENMDNPSYSDVSDVVQATDSTTQVTITDGLLNGLGHYRVKLVE